MSHKPRPRHHRRPAWDEAAPIAIRVGHRRSQSKYHEMRVFGDKDAPRFARVVADQVHAHPNDPLIINVNGYAPWLGDVLHSCIDEDWSEIADLDRAVQFASTMQFPEKASKRGRWVPWSFIIEYVLHDMSDATF